MGSVVRAAAAALVFVALASAATAQMESCNGELPPVLAANYSGLACQPVWNNFVLRVRTRAAPVAAVHLAVSLRFFASIVIFRW
jgi:hypothetical protein